MKIKRITAKFLSLFSIFTLHSSCSKDELSLEGKTKILLIGNSFSEDAISKHFAELSKSAGETVVLGSLFISGGSLENHALAMRNNTRLKYREFNEEYSEITLKLNLTSALKRHDWKYVSIQQHSKNSGVYSSYSPFLKELVNVIDLHTNATIILHQTWSYESPLIENENLYKNNSFVMFDSIYNTTSRLAEENNLKLIRTGEVINSYRKLDPNVVLTTDGKHLNRYGKYIAAFTWYSSIFNNNNHRYFPAGYDPEFLNTVNNLVNSTVHK